MLANSSVDWSALSSIVAIVTALIAISALIMETRYSRMALQTEALLGLTEKNGVA